MALAEHGFANTGIDIIGDRTIIQALTADTLSLAAKEWFQTKVVLVHLNA